MRGRKLKMVALFRIRDRAAGKKRAAHEGRLAAGLLDNAEIYMQRGVFHVVAEGVVNYLYLFRLGYGEAAFCAVRVGQPVKADAEGFFEQMRQPPGKFGAGSAYAYLPRREAAAVQQNAVGLGDGTAFALDPRLAQLALNFLRKGFFHRFFLSLQHFTMSILRLPDRQHCTLSYVYSPCK